MLSLTESCKEYLGELLQLRCIYGWGWNKNADAPFPPHDCDFELLRLWINCSNMYYDGMGIIHTTNHELNNWWILFSARHKGIYDFEENIGDFNITICNKKPKVLNSQTDTFEYRAKIISGFGQIMHKKPNK